MFKCLFKQDSPTNVVDMETLLWTKFSAYVKKHILEKILSMFHCGVRPVPRMIGPLPRLLPPTQVKKWQRTNTFTNSEALDIGQIQAVEERKQNKFVD